jgi:hypothetical protein
MVAGVKQKSDAKQKGYHSFKSPQGHLILLGKKR